jgi:tRNA threonylcarbamoyladenosine biosynthesis protein TsaB
MPRVEKIVKQANFNLADADFLVAVTGAGSFTGIRIGVSTVKALCFAYKKPCLNITSFDTLAYNEPCGKTLAVIDAKHGGYYVCGYDNGKVDFQPSYVLTEQLKDMQNEYALVADGVIEGFPVKTVSVLDGLVKAIETTSAKWTSDKPQIRIRTMK